MTALQLMGVGGMLATCGVVLRDPFATSRAACAASGACTTERPGTHRASHRYAPSAEPVGLAAALDRRTT